MKFLICLLFSITVFSQGKPIELVIDSINTSSNDDNERQYTLSYHIKNLTQKAISFALDTEHIIPISAGSLRAAPYYKIYENDKSFDAVGIFYGKRALILKNEKQAQAYFDSLMASRKSKTPEQLLQEKKEDFLNSIQTLQPEETKTFRTILIWNKQRYFRNDPFEYYIDEKQKYYFELHINLMAEELLYNVPEEEQNVILKEKNLTRGWYTSNKVPIDFGE